MTPSTSRGLAAASLAALLALSGCTRDLDILEPADFPQDADIFAEEFGSGVTFQAFGGSKVDALQVDRTEHRTGVASLRVTIPGPGDPSGGYAGGAFVTTMPRDLSGYDALTFWAKASMSASLNVAGVGNDNTGTSRFTAEIAGLPLTNSWTRYVIPIPVASRLDREAGLFYFAEGFERETGYTLWLDDIRFEKTGAIVNPRPAIPTRTVNGEVGATLKVEGTTITYDVAGVNRTVSAAPAYFTFSSSNSAVATVDAAGAISVVGAGTAVITAAVAGTPASGSVTINAVAPPSSAAPDPQHPATDVISLFSDAYDDVPVDTWSASWDAADVADVTLAGNATKKYTNLSFAGIEFTSKTVDATAMTHLHLDLWTQDPSAFRVKLVDFGANGIFGGGDDREHEITLDANTTPGLVKDAWNSLDIPLSAFAGLATRGHLAQMIISGASPTVYLDNIYFFKAAGPAEPTEAAPTPTRAAGNVIALFSNAYPNVPVDTWSASWDAADVADVQVAGDDVKRYTSLTFAGIEFTSQPVDASAMSGFHVDLWTPDATAAPAAFRIKLVDFGADGAFGGGDDVEHEITLNDASTPALETGKWNSLDIPLEAFSGLTTRGHLAQMIISGDPNTVFLDNVYFYRSAPTAPSAPAPTPTHAAANVVSLFSNAYTNVTVDTWSAGWDAADVADVQVAGDDVKLYTNLVFAGIEFTSATVDASGMTHLRFDLWTPDPTAAPAVFKVKLVDFGADGAWSGGDDVEHEITLDASSTPPLASGAWVSYDIPLSQFTGLTTRGHLAQLIISGDPNTVYLDNVYLHN